MQHDGTRNRTGYRASKPYRVKASIGSKEYPAFTYIRTGVGWFELAIVLNLYARRIVGWMMVPSMPAQLICDTLLDGDSTATPSRWIIFQGFQAARLPVVLPCFTEQTLALSGEPRELAVCN